MEPSVDALSETMTSTAGYNCSRLDTTARRKVARPIVRGYHDAHEGSVHGTRNCWACRGLRCPLLIGHCELAARPLDQALDAVIDCDLGLPTGEAGYQ